MSLNARDIFGEQPQTKIPTSLEELEQLVMDAARIEAGEDLEPDAPPSAAPSDWPDPEPLGSELPPVPAFDQELLPDALRPWCLDLAERMQVPLDLPAVAAVAALGAAVMRRASIQPKVKDTDWVEYGNVWGALVAESGLMKSPIMDAATDTLCRVESLWRVEYESEVANAKAGRKIAELRERAWSQEYIAAYKKATDKKNFTEPGLPDDSIPEPRQKRLLITDATFEKLHEIVSVNPAGIACWRDELMGWLAGLERPERKSERQFYLEGWRGHTQHNIERIGRGSIFVPHLCVSVFGAIQPQPLRGYLADVLRGGPTNDGLMQRFGLLVWPDFDGKWRYVDKLPDSRARQKAAEVYERLCNLDAESPLRLRYTDTAQELFIEWLIPHQGKVLSLDTPPIMRSHLSKYRKLMPALSLLFALADDHADAVPLKSAKRAAAWCEYLEPHAARVYSSRLTPEIAAAQTLGRKLKGGWHGEQEGSFTLRDAYRPQWTGLTTKDEARAALSVLIEYHWVRKAPNAKDKEGRPSEIYAINPGIAEVKS